MTRIPWGRRDHRGHRGPWDYRCHRCHRDPWDHLGADQRAARRRLSDSDRRALSLERQQPPVHDVQASPQDGRLARAAATAHPGGHPRGPTGPQA